MSEIDIIYAKRGGDNSHMLKLQKANGVENEMQERVEKRLGFGMQKFSLFFIKCICLPVALSSATRGRLEDG